MSDPYDIVFRALVDIYDGQYEDPPTADSLFFNESLCDPHDPGEGFLTIELGHVSAGRRWTLRRVFATLLWTSAVIGPEAAIHRDIEAMKADLRREVSNAG